VLGTAGASKVASSVGGRAGLTAGAGVVAGIAAGLGADWVYDHVIPDGLDVAGHAIANAGKAVGHFFSSICQMESYASD
jgi:hypothetical protein